MVKKLTNIVQGAAVQLNTNTDATYAIEKQMAIPFCYGSPEGAWEAAVAYNGTPSNHPGTFDNVGWVRGTTVDNGEWGAYLWIMQNKITFQSSTSALWTATNGISVAITNVMVGSLGNYQATSNYVDIGPHLDGVTNYPGSNQWESKDFWVDITNVYYQLSIPDIWISPRNAITCVGGSNVHFTVTGTNIPMGVDWSIIPVLTNGAGIQSNGAWQASVTPGTVGTNYKVRATSKDNPNFYDQVNLTVVGVASIELVSGATANNVIPTNTWVAVKNTNLTPEYVVLKAVLHPDVSEITLPDGFVTWINGEPVAGTRFRGKLADKHLSIHKWLRHAGERAPPGMCGLSGHILRSG